MHSLLNNLCRIARYDAAVSSRQTGNYALRPYDGIAADMATFQYVYSVSHPYPVAYDCITARVRTLPVSIQNRVNVAVSYYDFS